MARELKAELAALNKMIHAAASQLDALRLKRADLEGEIVYDEAIMTSSFYRGVSTGLYYVRTFDQRMVALTAGPLTSIGSSWFYAEQDFVKVHPKEVKIQ